MIIDHFCSDLFGRLSTRSPAVADLFCLALMTIGGFYLSVGLAFKFGFGL